MKTLTAVILFLALSSSIFSQSPDSTHCKCYKNDIYMILYDLYNKNYIAVEKEYKNIDKYNKFPLISSLISSINWSDRSDDYLIKAKTIYESYCRNKPDKNNEKEFNAFLNDTILIKTDRFAIAVWKDKYFSDCISKIFDNLNKFGNCRELQDSLIACEKNSTTLKIEKNTLIKDTTSKGENLRKKIIENRNLREVDSTYKATERYFRDCIKMDSSNNKIYGRIIDYKSFNKFANEFVKDSITSKNEKIKKLTNISNIKNINNLIRRVERLKKDSIDKVVYSGQRDKLINDKEKLEKDTLYKGKIIVDFKNDLVSNQKKIKEQGESLLNLTNGISTLRLGRTIDEKKLKQVFKIDTLLFEKGSFNISSNYLSKLDSLSKIIVSNNEITAYIVGYADSEGADVYNLVLSELRAKSILYYFHKNAISWDRLNLIGFGEIDKNTNLRKVEIYLLK